MVPPPRFTRLADSESPRYERWFALEPARGGSPDFYEVSNMHSRPGERPGRSRANGPTACNARRARRRRDARRRAPRAGADADVFSARSSVRPDVVAEAHPALEHAVDVDRDVAGRTRARRGTSMQRGSPPSRRRRAAASPSRPWQTRSSTANSCMEFAPATSHGLDLDGDHRTASATARPTGR